MTWNIRKQGGAAPRRDELFDGAIGVSSRGWRDPTLGRTPRISRLSAELPAQSTHEPDHSRNTHQKPRERMRRRQVRRVPPQLCWPATPHARHGIVSRGAGDSGLWREPRFNRQDFFFTVQALSRRASHRIYVGLLITLLGIGACLRRFERVALFSPFPVLIFGFLGVTGCDAIRL
jgi:hypothetical protein